MQKNFLIAAFFSFGLCFSQSKEQLIDSIIKVNSLHGDCVGMPCEESLQYQNAQKLLDMLPNSELMALTKHNNPVIRTYASLRAIENGKGNPEQMLSNEINRNEYINEFDGCSSGEESVSSIIYHAYWNKIRLKSIEKISTEKERESTMEKALKTDVIMEKMDSTIIHSNKEIYWLLYSRCFENRKHKDSYLPKIEELAFVKNNPYAFNYLKRNYSSIYHTKLEHYLENKFPDVKFESNINDYFLNTFIQILLEERNEKYNTFVINKLRNDKQWREKSPEIEHILEKFNIKL